MGDQPGAGRAQSFKIKSHSRQRRSAKPYSRPSGHRKGVLESVKDFFSPSWLLDFWKGKKGVEEEESDDADNEDDEGETVENNQDVAGSSGVFERAGTSGSFKVYAPRLDTKRTEVLGNGGLVASVQRPSQTSQKSGLAGLMAIRSREPLNRKALEIRTTGFTSTSDSMRTDDRSTHTSATSRQITVETQIQRESSPQETTRLSLLSNYEPEPSPILNTTQKKPTPSLFGTSLAPGSSSTPIESQSNATPRPSLLSSERLSRPQPTSVFRSKPEFSVSAFGSPLPPRSGSQTRRYSSPYYSGNTMFGGASSQVNKASKRARISSPGSSEAAQPVKRQIRPTPLAGTSGSGVASQTAKRILETLEKMSSPLVDAKKIPPSPPSASPLSFTQSRRRKAPQQPYSKPVGSPKKLEARFGGPPVQSLSVPRRAAISRIQPKTDRGPSTSQITSTPLTTAMTAKTSSTITAKPIQSFVPTPLPMSLSPMESKGGGGGGKIKAARTSSTHYKSQAIDEEEEVVNPLPEITSAVSLAIPSGASLPSFTFTSALSSKSSPQTTSNNTQKQHPLSSLKSKSPDISSNNFKFSVPQSKTSSTNLLSNISSTKKIEYSFSSPAPVNNSETMSSDKSFPSNSLDKFKPAEGSWECSACMINNKADASSCIACSTPKPSPKQPSNDLFKKFQPPSGSWSCDACMLTNKETAPKCIACETPKPSSSKATEKPKTDLFAPKAKDTLLKQFAPPSDSWECSSCMLNNKAQDSKCVACQEPKPGAKPSKPTDNLLFKQFTPAEGSWTCDTCMIVNKSDTEKCLACTTPKPGATSSATSSGVFKVSSDSKTHNSPFQFGSSESSSKDNASNITVTFGAPSSSSSSNPFKLASTSTSTTPFVFGAASTSTSSDKSFTFGSSSTSSTSKTVQFGATTTTDSSNSTSKFGSSEGTTQSSFQFGGKGADSQSSDTAPTLKFGSTEASADKQPSVQFGSSAKAEIAQPGAFTFGSSAKSTGVEKKISATSQPKVGSIAQAAASGLLKIPSSVDVVDLTSGNSNPEPPKPQDKEVAPPNVNLFAGKGLPSSSKMFEASTALKTDQPPTTTLPSYHLPSYAFGAPVAVTKPSEEPPKAVAAFAFKPSTTSTGIPKFGQTAAPHAANAPSTAIPKFGEPSIPSAAISAGFQFGSALSANQPTTSTAGAPQFSTPTQQSTLLGGFSDTSKTTASALSNSPFVFKGTGDATDKLASTSATPKTGFAFGNTAPTGNGGFAFGSGATNTPKPSSGSIPGSFAFGAQTAVTQKSTGFAFGSSNQQPFAFGGSSTNTAPQMATSPQNEESMDADGNNNNSNQPTVPVFGSTVAPAAPTASPFSFTPAAPANTGYNFAGAQPPASFKFGDSSNSNPPVFGGSAAPAFGGTTGTTLQQGTNSGFNFSSPASNNIGSQPSGFSVGAGAATTFSAGSGVAQKRVIKRGIRRSRLR